MNAEIQLTIKARLRKTLPPVLDIEYNPLRHRELRPSADQPPPCATKQSACVASLEVSGAAK